MMKKNITPQFLALWGSSFISAIGSGMTAFGLGVYLFQQTGLVTPGSIVTLLGFLPAILLGTFTGVLADRYDRRLLMILGDSLSIIGLLLILIPFMQEDLRVSHIYIGVTIASVFTALIEPAFTSTITDLVPPEQYAQASGLVQLTSAAKYLISPIFAGFLLHYWDMRLILMLDISTVFLTIMTTFFVRKKLTRHPQTHTSFHFFSEFNQGIKQLVENKGVLLLVGVTAFITLFLGMLQTLFTPFILSFSNTDVLGVLTTTIAVGMLVSSFLISQFEYNGLQQKRLVWSLCCAGCLMILLGLTRNLWFIGICGFLFFMTLPYANTSIDVLIRLHIPNAVQGRIWGLIGFISQLGYVVAYGLSGMLVDTFFKESTETLIILAGVCLLVITIMLANIPALKTLEKKKV